MKQFFTILFILLPFFGSAQTFSIRFTNIGQTTIPSGLNPVISYSSDLDLSIRSWNQIVFQILPGASSTTAGTISASDVTGIVSISPGGANYHIALVMLGDPVQMYIWENSTTNCLPITTQFQFHNQNTTPVLIQAYDNGVQMPFQDSLTLYPGFSGGLTVSYTACDTITFRQTPLSNVNGLGQSGTNTYNNFNSPPSTSVIAPEGFGLQPYGMAPQAPPEVLYTNTAVTGTNSTIVWSSPTNGVVTDQQGFNVLAQQNVEIGAQAHSDADAIGNGLVTIGSDVVSGSDNIAAAVAANGAFLSNVLHGLSFASSNSISVSNNFSLSNYDLETTQLGISNLLAGVGLDTNGLGALSGTETNPVDFGISQITNYADAMDASHAHEDDSGMTAVNTTWTEFIDGVTGPAQDDLADPGDMSYTFPGTLGTIDFNPLNSDWCSALFSEVKQFLIWILSFIYLRRCLDDAWNAIVFSSLSAQSQETKKWD